jgi:predicted nuclease with TOPRIM domain
MKHFIILITVLSIFASCKEDTSVTSLKGNPVKIDETLVEQSNDELTSRLKSKVERLSHLEHNYIFEKFSKITIEKSSLVARFKYLSDSEYTPEKLKFVDVEKLKNSISKTYQCFIKGTKEMYSGSKLYPRAYIGEYIFKTKEHALKAFETLNELRKDGNLWIHISKSPNSMFLEDNRIYYIDSGGWYMLDIYEDIEKEMKSH